MKCTKSSRIFRIFTVIYLPCPLVTFYYVTRGHAVAHSYQTALSIYPPFTWAPQKWVEPGFNPLYTFHMRTSNRVQPAFYTRVQPTSEGGLNSHLSEFEVLEKMADRGRMRTNAEIPLVLNVWSEDSIQRQLQGSPCSEVPYKKIATELGNAVHRKWNVGIPILNFLFHYASSHPATMRSTNV